MFTYLLHLILTILYLLTLHYFVGVPFITSLTGNVKVREGQDINLACQYNSKTAATISWLKHTSDGNNITVPNSYYYNATTLLIRNVIGQDSAAYTCNATNDFGSAYRSVDITVQCKLYIR